jgi:hypothetical protein
MKLTDQEKIEMRNFMINYEAKWRQQTEEQQALLIGTAFSLIGFFIVLAVLLLRIS